jgi:undecaprenyl-diphosphatase
MVRSDLRTSARAQDWQAPAWFARWMRAASRLGDGWLWIALVALPASGNPGTRDLALVGIVAAAVNNLCLVAAKRAVRRPRPLRTCADGPSPPDAFSFPSGHAANAFAACSVMGLGFPLLAPAFGALAVSVAASRVVVGLHYPSDVVAGAGLGSLVVAASAGMLLG